MPEKFLFFSESMLFLFFFLFFSIGFLSAGQDSLPAKNFMPSVVKNLLTALVNRLEAKKRKHFDEVS